MVHKQKKRSKQYIQEKENKTIENQCHSHTRGGEETYTHFHEQTKSVEKLHQHSETILESSQQPRNLLWQQIRHDSQRSRMAKENTHKNRIYPKNQPRNMFARDG